MKKSETTIPRTIADLTFNWEFVNYSETDYPSIEIAQEQVSKKNPKLKGFRVVPNSYLILINDRKFHLVVYANEPITVTNFFELVCFRCFINHFPITGKFSHFERIDDQTYRIHMKS